MVNIALAEIKSAERIAKARIKAGSAKEASQKARFKSLQKIEVAPQLSKEQNMLQEMFGGNGTWGTGRNLPKMEGILRRGHGLIKNDDDGETASMFGGFR